MANDVIQCNSLEIFNSINVDEEKFLNMLQ